MRMLTKLRVSLKVVLHYDTVLSNVFLTLLLLPSDTHYATVQADLESDAQGLEVESWSLAVDQCHVKKHSKEMVKRQDVIYGKYDTLLDWSFD